MSKGLFHALRSIGLCPNANPTKSRNSNRRRQFISDKYARRLKVEDVFACPCGKKTYRGRQTAREIASQMSHKYDCEFDAYRCRESSRWHVGRTNKLEAA